MVFCMAEEGVIFLQYEIQGGEDEIEKCTQRPSCGIVSYSLKICLIQNVISCFQKKSKETNLEGKSLEKLSKVSKTSKISSSFLSKEEPKLPEIRHGNQFANEFNKMQDLVLKKPTSQIIMTMETLKKIQIDR